MPPSLTDFQRRFPATRLSAFGAEWTLRDTDQDAARVPLVLLPGAGATGDSFHLVADGLRSTRRVVSVSYPPLENAAALADGLLAVLSEAGIGTFDLFGSSLGGYLAQLCALRAPTRIRRCMIANSFVDTEWLQRKISRDKLAATSATEHLASTLAQLRSLGEDTAEKAGFKHTMLALVGTAQTAEMAKSALLAVLGATPLPPVPLPPEAVAILDTRDDPVVDEPTRSAMRERYQRSPQFRLDAGGHYPALLNPGGLMAALSQHFSAD